MATRKNVAREKAVPAAQSAFGTALQRLVSDRVEVLFCANENATISNGRRCVNRFANSVGGHELVYWASFNDEGVTIFTRQENLAVDSYRRRRECRGNGYASTLVLYLSGLRVQTGKDAAISRQVEIVSVKNW
jgi:hypothetical protein